MVGQGKKTMSDIRGKSWALTLLHHWSALVKGTQPLWALKRVRQVKALQVWRPGSPWGRLPGPPALRCGPGRQGPQPPLHQLRDWRALLGPQNHSEGHHP